MEVEFTKAKYSTRVFAFSFDLLCMVISALLMILGSRAIVGELPFYKDALDTMQRVEIESGLYVETPSGNAMTLYEYYEPSDILDVTLANQNIDEKLQAFYANSEYFPENDGISLYNKAKLDSGYYVYEDDTHTNIVLTPNVDNNAVYEFLKSVCDNDAKQKMITNGDYISSVKTLNLSYVFLVLLVPIVLSIIIYEFIFPVIFRRGRKTLGKLVFKIAVVDSRGLTPTFGRFMARFGLLAIVELLLSAVTFCIPLIVSFTMLAVGKKQQSFHDYVAGTYVVDASTCNIFLNEKEYIEAHKKADEFELKKEDVSLF